MKIILVTVLLAASLSASPLFAADMAANAPVYKAAPVQQMFNWSGFYVGGYAGWMSAKTKEIFTSPTKIDGGAFGGLAGINWQSNNFVFGFEGDGGWSTAKNGSTGPFAAFEDRFIGNLRLRAGLANDRVLLFLAGGASFTNERIDTFANDHVSKTRVGWTIGGGLDYAATQNLILRIEYLYADFNPKTFVFSGNDIHSVDYYNQNTVRAAAIWKW